MHWNCISITKNKILIALRLNCISNGYDKSINLCWPIKSLHIGSIKCEKSILRKMNLLSLVSNATIPLYILYIMCIFRIIRFSSSSSMMSRTKTKSRAKYKYVSSWQVLMKVVIKLFIVFNELDDAIYQKSKYMSTPPPIFNWQKQYQSF